MKKSHVLFLILSTSLFFNAHAAEGMKPGLWEHSFTMKSQSGKVEKAMADMKKQMASMPAEQRKMVEEMMAKQGLSIGAGKPRTVKVCISKEQAEKMDIPTSQNENCKNEITKRTATNVSMKFTCSGTPKSDGTADFTLKGPTAYTGKAVINMTTKEGAPDRMDMDSSGKWLAADCGDIKPLPTKK
ncbi:MAG: DUF3617 domain-containing protein [Rhizobacter sp.]|nr:DUF3617 domain-containing protein [Bacteriovorax sp.]